jgi:hypothetical protein
VSEQVDLRKLLLGKQQELTMKLGLGDLQWHPTAKGEVSEANWQAALNGRQGNGFLPSRYAVSKAFIIDSQGQRSDQIDLVIHDAHYCPLLFEDAGNRYIPAESVYAVFEVKPELNRENVIYAAGKAASVRRLHRTSAPIRWIGGISEPDEPFDILAGILATRVGWADALGDSLVSALNDTDAGGRLDLGAVAAAGAFEVTYDDGPRVTTNDDDAWLMHFLTRLYSLLQERGTVRAIDLAAYTHPAQT